MFRLVIAVLPRAVLLYAAVRAKHFETVNATNLQVLLKHYPHASTLALNTNIGPLNKRSDAVRYRVQHGVYARC